MRTIILLLAWLSLSASALSQNLVAYYPFNGNANDQSGNAINPTYIGSGVILTTDRFGNANKAYSFDGTTNSYMRMPSDLLPTANRTVSFWFNAASVSIRPFMLAYGGNGGAPGTSFLMGLNASGCGCYHTQAHYNTNAVSFAYSPDPVNQWIHWVVTINGSTTKMFVNGTQVANVPGSFTSNTYVAGRDLAIGVMVNALGIAPYTDVNGSYFQGKLDDIRIYDNAMTDAQVQDLYASEAMVAYYPFNGNASDETGNGNNSTYTGTGVTLTTDRFGNVNKAYYFDGAVGSYIRVPADKFPTTDRTISFWFNADQLGYYIPTPFSYGGNGCNNSLLMIINHYNYTNSYLAESHCGANVITAPYTVEPVNNWYHLTLTISGTTQKIFVNGVLQQSTSSFTSPTYVTGTSALLGACINTDGNTVFDGYFRGKLDEFRIYNTAMTDAQVLALHTNEAGSPALAYYPFNGNANDESGNGYNGTVSGATLSADRFNQSGKAYNFIYNGFSSDKIQVPGTSSLNFSTGGFSISAWVQFSGTAGVGNNYPIVSKHNCGEQSGYILMLYNDKLTFWLAGAGGYNVVTTPDNYTDGKWHHVVAVYDGTVQYIYADGILKNSAAFVYSNFNIANWTLGGYNGCNGGFNGKVDEIKVFDRPLTAGEINGLYKQTVTDMVAYYPFNGNANDESGNNINLANAGATLTTDRLGNANRAYYFNGSANLSSTDKDLLDLTSDFTISYWIKRASDNLYQFVMSKHYSGADSEGSWGICSYTANTFSFQATPYWGTGASGPTSASVPINQWQHLAFTYKKSTGEWSWYLNGQLTGNGTISYNIQNTNRDFKIGSCMPNEYRLNASLDEVRIYNRVLSPNEILQLADVPMMPDLIAYLPMNGNANDMSGNGHNGTVVNVTATTDKYGNTNSAYAFDPYQSDFSLANSASLDFIGNNQKFTLSAWVKYTGTRELYQAIISKFNTGSAGPGVVNGYMLGTYYNNYRFWMPYGNSGNWNIVETPCIVGDTQWHHIVGTYDGTMQSLYVDGVLKSASPEVYIMPATGAPVKIGSVNVIGYPTGGGVFNGSVDEVKIYGDALDTAQVMAMYKQSRGSGNAIQLDGADDKINVGTGWNATNFTFEAWIKPDINNTNRNTIFSPEGNEGWYLQIQKVNEGYGFINRVYFGIGSDYRNIIQPYDGEWHHLAITAQDLGSNFVLYKVYWDGVYTGQLSVPRVINSNTTNYYLGIRNYLNDMPFTGKMDEVRYWNTDLNQSQISQWMNRKVTPEHPAYSNLVHYYNFDEKAIFKTYDLSSSNSSNLINGPVYVSSGASIGDKSNIVTGMYSNPGATVTLNSSTGESYTATMTSARNGGVAVYEILDIPENISGILGLGSNNKYFGVFPIKGLFDPSLFIPAQYSLNYNYTGNPFVSPAIEPTLQLFKRNDNSAANWTNSGAALNTIANTLTVTGQNTEYILGSSGFALPVSLLNFKVQKINETTAALSWQTASEINNRGFEIQRSFDGSNFLDVKFVNGAGNAAETINYNTTDVPGKTGRVYYRLKQVDMDGNSRMSNIVSVLFDKTGSIKLYPNPAQQYVIVEGAETYRRIQVVDITGRLVKDMVNEHQYRLNIDLAGLKSGNYFIRLMNETELETIRFSISN